MPLIYVTGVAASGKSAVAAELNRRGSEAHGVDEEGYADWIARDSGRIVTFPRGAESQVNIHDWYERHRWVLSEERIAWLKERSDQVGHRVFLAGVAEGDAQVWHLFDHVIALSVDETTVRRRIEARRDNQFGKTSAEMEDILKWLRSFDETYRGFGAVIVDASKPLDQVVDEILALVGD